MGPLFRADGPPVLVEYHCEYGEFVDSLIDAEPIAHGLKPGDPLPPELFEPISPRWRDADFEVRSVLETQIILFAQQPDPNDPSRRELRIRVGYYRAQSGRLFWEIPALSIQVGCVAA